MTETIEFEERPTVTVMGYRSGDYPGAIMWDVLDHFDDNDNGRGLWGETCWHHDPHSCVQHVQNIADDMAVNGWNGPPVAVRDARVINGHHRVTAAFLAGLPTIRVTQHDCEW